MNIWFTSDHHFGHANIIKYANRPFSSVEEMDEEMITRWNEAVKDDDLVYHLGDLSLNRRWNTVIIEYISKLNGNIVLVPGGHDKFWLSDDEKNFMFTDDKIVIKDSIVTVTDLLPKKDGYEVPIIMCHYPMLSWDRSHYGSIHLHGHSHGNIPSGGNRLDVGVDTNKFYPYSLDDILHLVKGKKYGLHKNKSY